MIKLTIDSGVQQQTFAIFDKRPGSAVITDPQKGDLLATANSPLYGSSKIANGISQKEYDAYNNNRDLPFTTRFTTGYASGSTSRTITGATGLDAGMLKPDEELEISGSKWQKDKSWNGYFTTRVREADPVNPRTALVNSDDIYFARQTLRMGEDKFRIGLNKFIFGEGLDLPIAMASAQVSNEDKFNSEIFLADTDYDQSQLLISPIQQVTVYSVFQNNGTLVCPKPVLDKETKKKNNVISANAANTITTDPLGSMEDPSGHIYSMYSPNLSLAAKTGTAEIRDKRDTDGKENSFLLTSDCSDNKFLTMIMIENSGEDGSVTDISKPLIDYLEATIR